VREIDLGMAALATLIPVSVLAGIGMLLVSRHASDQTAVRRAKSLAQAHLLEFRLFMDEPRLILRAQRDLIAANLRFLKLMLRPVLVLAIPMGLLLSGLSGFYGHAPLRVGEAAIVTARIADATRLGLKAPGGIAVETPAVQVAAEHQVSWRIRPLRATSGELEIVHDGNVFRKSVCAGPGVHFLSERRGSVANFLLNPGEPPLTDGAVGWIEVRYPSAVVLRFHWLIWFFVISAIAVLALRRKLRATL
jgi:hypothetical protein